MDRQADAMIPVYPPPPPKKRGKKKKTICFALEMVESIAEERIKCLLLAFPTFPTMFSESFFLPPFPNEPSLYLSAVQVF